MRVELHAERVDACLDEAELKSRRAPFGLRRIECEASESLVILEREVSAERGGVDDDIGRQIADW
jgi:hypothetical protein